jgi:uncharacterized RDD family membrane protein YckC
MRRFFPYLLGLLLIGVAPAQEEQPTVVENKDEPAEAAETDSTPELKVPRKDVVEEDTTEAVVEGNKVKQRTRTKEVRRRRPPTEPHIRTDFTVKNGETSGEIVIIDGELRVEGEVDGNIVAIASKAFIDGRVRGSVVVVPGPVTFGPNADIADETVVVGEFHRDNAAKFGRHFQAVPIPNLVPIVTGAKDFVFEGVIMMRPLPPSVRWVWVLHGAMLLILVGLTLLFPKPVEVGAKAIADRPVVSIFSGFLTALLFVPVLLLLVVTVVGIIAVPFAIAGICIAALFGKASVLEFIGQQVGRNLRTQLLESPLIALLIGAVILALFYMVPVLGMLVWCVATLLGLGAIMVATASTLNSQPSEPTPAGVAPGATIAAPPLSEPAPPQSIATSTAAPVLLKRAGFWKRTFAAFLDWVLLGIPIVVSSVLTPPIFPLILIGYFVTMWTWKGTSVGKICLGLKIVRTDGTPIDFPVALVRSLAACFSFMVFLLGFFWAGWDKEKQSWHDKIAGTVVVQVPKGVSLL